MADEHTNMTDEQMQVMNSQFARMDERFARMDERFDKIDERFDKMDQRFDKMDERVDKTDERLDRMDRHFGNLKAEVSAQQTTLERVDAEVHRQGVLREQEHGELRLAIEAFQTLQKVTNAKIDLVQDGIDQRR